LSENRVPPNPLVNHKCPYQKPHKLRYSPFSDTTKYHILLVMSPTIFFPIPKNPRHFIIASFQKAGKSVIVFPCLPIMLGFSMIFHYQPPWVVTVSTWSGTLEVSLPMLWRQGISPCRLAWLHGWGPGPHKDGAFF
jgi:hypothetical protein